MKYWRIPPSPRVVSPGLLHPQHDQSRAGAAHVVRLGDRYRMAYWGSDSDGLNYILQAETSVVEPNSWQPVGSFLIGPQTDTDHNCRGPSFPFLLPVTADRWLLTSPRGGAELMGNYRTRRGLPPRTMAEKVGATTRSTPCCLWIDRMMRRGPAVFGSCTRTDTFACTTPQSGDTSPGPQA